MSTEFKQLNHGWNAEPNAPEPRVSVRGSEVELVFAPNPFQFPDYEQVETLTLTFVGCRKYRLGPTNDEGWLRGKCRFSGLAPAWGEFYEVSGDLKLDELTDRWQMPEQPGPGGHHYLLYMRDETFECEASGWSKRP